MAPTESQTDARQPTLAKAPRPRRRDERPAVRTALPSDVVADATRRVRVVALIYAASFLAAGPLSALISPAARETFFATPLRWAPSTISIAVALLVVAASL